MSIEIKWHPLDNGARVPTGTPSRTWEILKDIADGDELHTSHLGALRALAKADPSSGAWPHLIEAIERHGTILLTTVN